MKKEYNDPKITISRFSAENIVTSSGVFASDTYEAAYNALTTGDAPITAENIFSFVVE